MVRNPCAFHVYIITMKQTVKPLIDCFSPCCIGGFTSGRSGFSSISREEKQSIRSLTRSPKVISGWPPGRKRSHQVGYASKHGGREMAFFAGDRSGWGTGSGWRWRMCCRESRFARGKDLAAIRLVGPCGGGGA